jgi:hypothetical protein
MNEEMRVRTAELDEARTFLEVGEIVQQCFGSSRRTGPVRIAAINRIGRPISCMVTCSPLDGTGDAVVLLMEEAIQELPFGELLLQGVTGPELTSLRVHDGIV